MIVACSGVIFENSSGVTITGAIMMETKQTQKTNWSLGRPWDDAVFTAACHLLHPFLYMLGSLGCPWHDENCDIHVLPRLVQSGALAFAYIFRYVWSLDRSWYDQSCIVQVLPSCVHGGHSFCIRFETCFGAWVAPGMSNNL